MKPSFTPCFFSNTLLVLVAQAPSPAVMSTSLKVVSMAAVFWASFRRRAMVWRRRVMRTRSSRAGIVRRRGRARVNGGGRRSRRRRRRGGLLEAARHIALGHAAVLAGARRWPMYRRFFSAAILRTERGERLGRAPGYSGPLRRLVGAVRAAAAAWARRRGVGAAIPAEAAARRRAAGRSGGVFPPHRPMRPSKRTRGNGRTIRGDDGFASTPAAGAIDFQGSPCRCSSSTTRPRRPSPASPTF